MAKTIKSDTTKKKGGVSVAASVMANLSDAVLPATYLRNECLACNDKL